VKHDREVIHKTFNALHAESVNAKQIGVAQEYAMSVARVAELEASRSHELEGHLKRAYGQLNQWQRHMDELQFQLSLDEAVLQMQTDYIKLLHEYIEENNLPVPAPVVEELPKLPNKST